MHIESISIESQVAEGLAIRARLHAALGDQHRLAVVDQLTISDRTPSELAAILKIDSNLLAHHLGVLERLHMIERVYSQGDRRRRYVQLVPSVMATLGTGNVIPVIRVIFVCTENAARSQIAAALWNNFNVGVTATSGGTHPAERVHPGAIRALRRRGYELRDTRPRSIPAIAPNDLVVTVCDKAHEELSAAGGRSHVHWSVADPLASHGSLTFELVTEMLARRVENLASHVEPMHDT